MSKFLNVPNGDYQIQVQTGGLITLDTGFETGEVRVTGNLTVIGNTTTVQSADLSITDNIIYLNANESGAGITLDRSGVSINRGSLSDAFFVFNENVTWRDPLTNTNKQGGFVLSDEDNNLVGLRTSSITTGGGDLYLISNGTGVISVTGTTDYELNVTDDDDITNKKYVDDAISTAFQTVFLPQIGDGDESLSSVAVRDKETTGTESKIVFSIDDTVVSELYRDRWELENIRLFSNVIEITEPDTDLVLKSNGVSSVTVKNPFYMDNFSSSSDISFPATGVKLYSSDQGTGKTGIYYANYTQEKDELISKNRSLLFSMIF